MNLDVFGMGNILVVQVLEAIAGQIKTPEYAIGEIGCANIKPTIAVSAESGQGEQILFQISISPADRSGVDVTQT